MLGKASTPTYFSAVPLASADIYRQRLNKPVAATVSPCKAYLLIACHVHLSPVYAHDAHGDEYGRCRLQGSISASPRVGAHDDVCSCENKAAISMINL